jgi:hypothetical protein
MLFEIRSEIIAIQNKCWILGKLSQCCRLARLNKLFKTDFSFEQQADCPLVHVTAKRRWKSKLRSHSWTVHSKT